MLSVIIPAYNEEAMIDKTASVISEILADANISCELLFVDDGSQDKTWEKITAISLTNPVVGGIHFSRNFGKDAAIIAGLTESHGDCCVVIDCDLQHPPKKSLRCIAYGSRDMKSLRVKNPAVAQKERYIHLPQRLSIL